MNAVQNLQEFRVRVIPGVWSCTYPKEHNPLTHRSSGYGYGSLIEITEVPGRYTSCTRTRYPYVPAPGYFCKGIPIPRVSRHGCTELTCLVSSRYGYECPIELTEVPGTGMNAI